MRRLVLLLLSSLALVACDTGPSDWFSGFRMPGRAPLTSDRMTVSTPTTYTNPSTGQEVSVSTGRDQCIRACNKSASRCGDMGPTRRGPEETHNYTFGASADCDKELRYCLDDCRQR
jgi:hypothetical protein